MLRRSVCRLGQTDGTMLTGHQAMPTGHQPINVTTGKRFPAFRNALWHSRWGNFGKLCAEKTKGLPAELQMQQDTPGGVMNVGSAIAHGRARNTIQEHHGGAMQVAKQWPAWYFLLFPAAILYTYILKPMQVKYFPYRMNNIYLTEQTVRQGVYGSPVTNSLVGPMSFGMPLFGTGRFQPTNFCAGTYQPRGSRTGVFGPYSPGGACGHQNGFMPNGAQQLGSGYKDLGGSNPRDNHYPGHTSVQYLEDGRSVPQTTWKHDVGHFDPVWPSLFAPHSL